MSGEIKANFKPLGGFALMDVDIPEPLVEQLNDYIDYDVITEDNSMSDRLVGQLNRTEKSKQLQMDMTKGAGKIFKTFLDGLGSAYVQNQMGDKGGKADTVDLWSNDAYEGDWQPLHMHGSQTPAGLSGFAYLQVPDSIAAGPPGYQVDLNNASGQVDGYTQLVWGNTNVQDLLQLKPQGQAYIKPEVGKMLLFPCWLYHQVGPFFGEGMRRSIAFNLNIHNSPEYLARFKVNVIGV